MDFTSFFFVFPLFNLRSCSICDLIRTDPGLLSNIPTKPPGWPNEQVLRTWNLSSNDGVVMCMFMCTIRSDCYLTFSKSRHYSLLGLSFVKWSSCAIPPPVLKDLRDLFSSTNHDMHYDCDQGPWSDHLCFRLYDANGDGFIEFREYMPVGLSHNKLKVKENDSETMQNWNCTAHCGAYLPPEDAIFCCWFSIDTSIPICCPDSLHTVKREPGPEPAADISAPWWQAGDLGVICFSLVCFNSS